MNAELKDLIIGLPILYFLLSILLIAIEKIITLYSKISKEVNDHLHH